MVWYEYANARILALKGRLFSEDDLARFGQLESVEALIARLEVSPYREAMKTALVRFRGARAVFEAVRLRLGLTSLEIPDAYGAPARQALEALNGRWDLFNLRSIMRAQRGRMAADDVAGSLVPGGVLADGVLAVLARQADARATAVCLAAVHSGYAKAIRGALAVADQDDEIAFEAAFEQRMYELLFDQLERCGADAIATEVLVHEIDARNAVAALRMHVVPTNARSRDAFVTTGGIPRALLERMTASDRLDEWVAFSREWHLIAGDVRPSDEERLADAIEREHSRWTLSLSARGVRTIAPAVAMLEALRLEALNLRRLALELELELGPERSPVEGHLAAAV